MRLSRTLALAATLILVGAIPSLAASAITWHMDDASGTSDPDGHTLDVQGVDAVDGYWHFDGTDRARTSGDDDAFDPGSATLTVTVHVRTTSFPSTDVGDYDLVRKGISSTTGGFWKVELIPNAKQTKLVALCQAKGSSGKTNLRKAPYSLDDGQWHTITCTKTSSTLSLTVDAKTYSRSVTVGSIANTDPLSIGAKASVNQDMYVGDMDEVTVSIG
jgi:hypothetical protein